MNHKHFEKILHVAETRRKDGIPNDDKYVEELLREHKIECIEILDLIAGLEEMDDLRERMNDEIAKVDHALTAYDAISAQEKES